MKQIIDEFMEGIIFESWLRFQFLEESSNSVTLLIPSDWQMELRKLAPALQEIARKINGKTPELDISRKALLDYMTAILETHTQNRTAIKEILASPEFQTQLDQYHIWLAQNEEFLQRMEFSRWLGTYKEWINAQASIK